MVNRWLSTIHRLRKYPVRSFRSFLGFGHNVRSFPKAIVGHEKSPYPKYIYIISISYIIILKKKTWLCSHELLKNSCYKKGLYMEVSQVMGVPQNHHIIHVLVGIFRCSMFFSKKTAIGVPQTMETGHGFIVQGTRHCSPGRSQRSNDSSATAVGFGVAEVSVQRHKV